MPVSLVTFVDHTIPVAADFNSNNAAINTEVRPASTGGSGKATWAKGDLFGASATNTPAGLTIGTFKGDQLAAQSSGPPLYAFRALMKTGANVNISNSGVETSLLGPVSILANTLGTATRIRLTILAAMSNTIGTSVGYEWKIKYGGTTLVTLLDDIATGVSVSTYGLTVDLMADGSTSAQIAVASVLFAGTTYTQGVGTAAVDSTAAQDFDVTMRMDHSSPNATFTARYRMVEVVN